MIPRYDSAVVQIVLAPAVPAKGTPKRRPAEVDSAPLTLVGPLRAREAAIGRAALEQAGVRQSEPRPRGRQHRPAGTVLPVQ